MIIKREDEIIGVLIQKDSKAEKIHKKACYYRHDEVFGKEVYEYNLDVKASEINIENGFCDPRILWNGFRKLDAEAPYDNGL